MFYIKQKAHGIYLKVLIGHNKFECTTKPVLSDHSKKTKNGLQDHLSINAGSKYCRMLQGEHSAILSTFIKLPFVIKIFVLSIFEWPFYTGLTVPVTWAYYEYI